MKKTALVICNGESPRKKLAHTLAKAADMVVAADGGANIARALHLRPDVIIGDLDSIAPATRRLYSSSLIIQVRRQDNTDLEKALDYLLEQRIGIATIIAATGKRLDHTLGNLSILWKYSDDLQLRFVGDGWTAMPVGRSKTVAATKGTTVSLMPFGECSGISLRGLKFPLMNATMHVGEIGVSNLVTASPFTVRVQKGNMLMMILDDDSHVSVVR